MERKFYQNLLYWKNSQNKLPLMIIGARQVGKTYLIKEFAQKEYSDQIYINFEEEKLISEFFENTLNPEKIIAKIEEYYNKKINIENTLIIFDEIQKCEKAITSLKYFCESENHYNVICAGSLLGVKINRFESSFPVGKVRIEYLYPLDFEEFLWAIGEKSLAEMIKEHFKSNKAIEQIFHEKIMNLYKEYTCIGGMPACINEFVQKDKKIVEFDKNIQESIVLSYIADMAKYTVGAEAIKTNEVYNSIPSQLGKENKKFQYKLIGNKTGGKRRYESSIQWLINSGIVLKSTLINDARPPIYTNKKENIFKIYLNDVGLLMNLGKIDFETILFDMSSIYKGMITENYVAQTLKKNGNELIYWESESKAEVDFIISQKGNIIPIEVKSSERVTSKSLTTYMKKYNPEYAIRISSKNFGFNNNIKSVPLYAVHLI